MFYKVLQLISWTLCTFWDFFVWFCLALAKKIKKEIDFFLLFRLLSFFPAPPHTSFPTSPRLRSLCGRLPYVFTRSFVRVEWIVWTRFFLHGSMNTSLRNTITSYLTVSTNYTYSQFESNFSVRVITVFHIQHAQIFLSNLEHLQNVRVSTYNRSQVRRQYKARRICDEIEN